MSGLGTDYTTTPHLGLYKPIANMAVGLWGDLWNSNADALDSAINFATGGGPFLPTAGGILTAPPASAVPALTINTSNNGVHCNNGLEVIQGYNGGGLAMNGNDTPHTASIRFGSLTFNDHNAMVFNYPPGGGGRATGQYNNLESVLTIPASPGSSQLTNAFTASVVDYSGGGALAGIFYAIAQANNTTAYAINSVCTDSAIANSGQFTGVREQIEFDYFVRNQSTTVRGVLTNLSATVPQLNQSSWIAYAIDLFPGVNTLPFTGATGTFTVGLVVTGATSGAKATITTVTQTGATGTLTFSRSSFVGAAGFLTNEAIADTGTGVATANGYASAYSFPWSVGYSSGNGCANTAFLVGSTGVFGPPVRTGDKSQTVQFTYTDMTTATTQRAIAIYADPTFAGASGADLRFDSSYAGPANLTLDNLSYIKAMNAAGTASLPLIVVDGQNELCIGDGVATTYIRSAIGGTLAYSALFTSVANGMNTVTFTGAAAGSAPTISSFHGHIGTDTNIGLNISAFGTGVITLGSPTRINGNVGFNTAPIARPSVAGAWAGNTAGKALSTALAALGLITDTSTA